SEERFVFVALYRGSVWKSDMRYYNSTARRDTVVRSNVQILTDRALVHPGDSIQAVVVAYSSRQSDMFLNESMSFDVVLRDSNGKDVASKPVTTDHFGRAVVDFEVPEQGLLGSWQLCAYDSSKNRLGFASVQVADYVAPTFFLTSEHSDEDVNPGDIVALKGQVLTYSGMPVGGASVRYSVSYTPPMRWYSTGFATYDSSVTADAEGKYEIELPTANLKGTQFERGIFTVKLAATSPSGETQNGPTERFAIGQEYTICNRHSSLDLDVSDGIKDIMFDVNDMLGRKVRKEVAYQLKDYASGKIVQEGTFISPTLQLKDSDLPSARYTLHVNLVEDKDIKDVEMINIWRRTDKRAPDGTLLWVPVKNFIASESESTVNVTVGSGVPDRWISSVLSSDEEILSVEWLHVDKDNLVLPIKGPIGKTEYRLNLTYPGGLSSEMTTVYIRPASSEEKLQVKTESFRDKVSAGDQERWSFRFFRKSSKASDIPAMAVMTDAALNAITPFNWSFSPMPNQRTMYYSMNPWFNPRRNMHESFSNYKYLSFSNISMPSVNDYGMGWGLDYVGDIVVRGYGTMRKASMVGSVQTTSLAIADDVKNEVMDMEEEVEADGAVAPKEEATVYLAENAMISGTANAGGTDDTGNKPDLRETECPIAFFMPDLVSDKDGMVNVDFTVPDFNTTWAFQLIGYDRELQTAKTTLEAVASKPIMVSTNAPRFVRTGDAIELTATVFNNSDAVCSPLCRFELVDLISDKTVASKDFIPESIGIASSRLLTMHWEVPSDLSAVG
ncbi:MAG: hypothetical protein K2H72_01835, partial [Muribaculaceae bacterium]|nr:hypothetical protein [Muribaculaceae bacterium]